MISHRNDARGAPFRSGSDEEASEATQLLDELQSLEEGDALTDDILTPAMKTENTAKELAQTVVAQAAVSTTVKAFKRSKPAAAEPHKRKGKFV